MIRFFSVLKKRVGYGAYLYKAGILVTLTLLTVNIGSLISESAVAAAVNEEFQAFRMSLSRRRYRKGGRSACNYTPHQPPGAFAARNEGGEGPRADRQEDGMPRS